MEITKSIMQWASFLPPNQMLALNSLGIRNLTEIEPDDPVKVTIHNCIIRIVINKVVPLYFPAFSQIWKVQCYIAVFGIRILLSHRKFLLYRMVCNGKPCHRIRYLGLQYCTKFRYRNDRRLDR